MRARIIFFIISFIFMGFLAQSQETTTPGESRKKNLKKLLDYRYRGGYYSFERLFHKTVEYPEVAKKNCVVGIIIARFEVNCEGEVKNLSLTNALRWGLENELYKFFEASLENWNKCEDDKYTKFEVPIQFTINDTETNDTDGMLIYEGQLVGYKCKSDSYYREKLAEAMEKNSKKKAIKNIDELIKRNPYESDLYTMKRDLLEKKKKK